MLAAGASSRLGRAKALLPWRGRTFLEHALAAASPWPTAVVLGANAPARMREAARGAIVVENDAPERGMSRSLTLASTALGRRDAPIAVLLVDTPLVTSELVARIASALGDADVAYPVRGGVAGHPVVFAGRVRSAFATLPPGDTVRTLRDAAHLRRVAVAIDGDAPYVDVDTEAAYADLLTR